MKDIQTTEKNNIPETEGHSPDAGCPWGVFFFFGCASFVLAIIGMACAMWGEGAGVGIHGTLSLGIPFFIGIPATSLSVILALAFRLPRSPISVILLSVYILLIGCVLLALLAVGVLAAMMGGPAGFLGPIFAAICLFGILATVVCIKHALTRRPSQLHISALLLLAHILVFTVNFAAGVIASC